METQWFNKLNKNRNKYKATKANGKGSNTQWQHKQQSTDNRQKVKYIEKPEQLQWNELKTE